MARSSRGIGSIQAASKGRLSVGACIVLLLVLLISSLLLSLALGRYEMDIPTLLAAIAQAFTGNGPIDATSMNVLLTIRMPRVIAAAIVGADLSIAGCAFQGIFRNPMVSPDLLGASSGACFGAALGILLSFSGMGIEISAFVMGLVAVAASMLLSKAVGRRMGGVLVLVLCGLVIGNLFQAFTSAMKFLADPNSQLPEITFWLMGGLSNVRASDLLALAVISLVGITGLFVLRWRLNVVSVGDEEALSMGVEVKRVRRATILLATLLTSASVAVSGMVGWVGLIIPHLARFIVGSDNRALIPASMLLGSSFLLLVDDLCRNIYTTEVPLSILTAIIGAPLFVFLIMRQREA